MSALGGAQGIGALAGGMAGKSLMGQLLGGGLPNILSNLFGGGQQAGGSNQQTNALLGDIKDMLNQLLDDKGGSGKGGDCGGASHGSCSGAEKPGCGHEEPSCGGAEEPGCGHEEPSCGDSAEPSWDGKDKSPSLDRERGAARLLDQAKNTDDPGEKRKLIEMALEMLGEGPKNDGPFGRIADKMDGNSYDKDIVKQAEKMLDQIDSGCQSDCSESKSLDQVIEMLMEEGGVDGKPASSDTNGNGRHDRGEGGHGRPMPMVHHHLHHALFNDR